MFFPQQWKKTREGHKKQQILCGCFWRLEALQEPTWPAQAGTGMLEMLLITSFHLGWRFWTSPRIWISTEALHTSGCDTLVQGSGVVAWSKGMFLLVPLAAKGMTLQTM